MDEGTTNVMDEAREDAGDGSTFRDVEAMKTILRLFLIGAGTSLNVTTSEEVNGCTTVEHFAKIAACVLGGLNKALQEHRDILNEKIDWQEEKVSLLRQKCDWFGKEASLEGARTSLRDQVETLKFEVELLKNEKQKQKELGRVNNQLKESRKTTKKLRAQVEFLHHNKTAKPETPIGAQRVPEVEMELASRDTALEKAQKLIQRLQNENHELAEDVDKSKIDKRALKAMTAERDEAKDHCEKLNAKLEQARVIEEQLRAKVAKHDEEVEKYATEKRKALHKSAEANRALEAQLKTAQKESTKLSSKVEKCRASENSLREEVKQLNACNITLQGNLRRQEDSLRGLQQFNAHLHAKITELWHDCYGKQQTIELLSTRVNELLDATLQLPSPASARVHAAQPQASSKQATSMKDLAAAIRERSPASSPSNADGTP